MYIIELFFKLKNNFKNRKNKKIQQINYDEEKCNHFFVPIDSTGQILACSKCGEIYKLQKGEINPFDNKESE